MDTPVTNNLSAENDVLEWYVAYVRSCQERTVASALERMGVECYVPVRKVPHKWSDRVKMVDELVLPRLVFVRTNPSERVRVIQRVPYMTGFMMDRGMHKPAVVRDEEMEVFRRMVGLDGRTVTVVPTLAPGDEVVVVAGPLKGCKCRLATVEGRRCMAVGLSMLGVATIALDACDVVKIREK